jgi:PS-10 peptidase S37
MTILAEVPNVRWMVTAILLAAFLGLAATGTASAQNPGQSPAGADDIVTRLHELPNVTFLSEAPNPPPGFRQFFLEYRQPVDHRHPERGTFEQRLTLLHRDVSAPMVVFTSGYFNYDVVNFTYVTEPTRLTGANQLDIEHRYFDGSRPQPAIWKKLTIWQEATDEHAIDVTFKTLYPARWLATGISKGGMTAVYHDRFYPGDYAGTLAYSAPNDVTHHGDAYARFIEREVGTAKCRADLRRVQKEALRQRAGMEALMSAAAAEAGATFTDVGSLDKAFEFDVVDTPFLFWQYYDNEPGIGCDTIPPAGAPVADLYAFFDNVGGAPGAMLADSDQALELFLPYYYQAGTQLDYPVEPQRHLVKLLRHPYAETARAYFPRSVPMRLDPRAMPDIDHWVRAHGDHLIFTYGGVDPYGATPFRLGRGSHDSSVYVKPDGDHLTTVSLLSPDQRAEITATLRRWAGVTAPATALTATAAPAGLPLQALLHP